MHLIKIKLLANCWQKSNYRVLKVCVGFGGPEAMPGGMNSREGIYGVSPRFLIPNLKWQPLVVSYEDIDVMSLLVSDELLMYCRWWDETQDCFENSVHCLCTWKMKSSSLPTYQHLFCPCTGSLQMCRRKWSCWLWLNNYYSAALPVESVCTRKDAEWCFVASKVASFHPVCIKSYSAQQIEQNWFLWFV